MTFSRKTLVLVIFILAGTLLVGCAGPSATPVPATEAPAATDAATVVPPTVVATEQETATEAPTAAPVDGPAVRKTLKEWAEEYPEYYKSYATIKTKEWTNSLEGHYTLFHKMLAPVLKKGNTLILNEEGDMSISGFMYDPVKNTWKLDESKYGPLVARPNDLKGCYACKSSVFESVLEREGEKVAAEKIDQEFLDEVNMQIWDCYMCHTDKPEDGYDATITMFKEITGPLYDELTPEDRVCGQCHNSTVHSPMFNSGKPWSEHQPFRYGFDGESMFKAAVEDGYGAKDEKTGIISYRTTHAELEFTYDSTHRAMGVNCQDCHMPTMTDPVTGKVFSDHNASGSPLENDAALDYCLTCHTNDEVKDREQMVDWVRTLQGETEAKQNEIKAKLETLKGLIEQAVTAGNVDATKLDEARTAYSKAKFLSEWGIYGNGAATVKVVHDSNETAELLEKAETVVDEGIALLK